MPELKKLFFFGIIQANPSPVIFICSQTIIRRLWSTDQPMPHDTLYACWITHIATVTRYHILTDLFFWSGDNSFTSDKNNYAMITEYEELSEKVNSAESWKTYRRWIQQIKREFMNACDRPQAGTLSDSSPELMPSFGSNKMPPRPKEIIAANEKYNKTEK